jgi:hypothetical protein
VLLKRQGNVVVERQVVGKEDTMQTVGRVVVEAKQDNPAEICVDSIGVGAGVADRFASWASTPRRERRLRAPR